MVKKIIKISLITIAILLALSFLVTVLVKVPRVQTYIVQKVAGVLSNKLHTKVDVGSVDIKFFKTAEIKNIYVEDQRHDTLLSLGRLQANIRLFSFFGKHLQLKFTELDDATVKLFRAHADSGFNFQFIINAFASKDTTTSKGGSKYQFSIDDFEMNNIKFVMRDESAANEIKVNLRHGIFNFKKVNLSVPLFDINIASIDSADVAFSDYSYLYPPSPDTHDTSVVHLNRKAFTLICKKFLMTNCSFTADMDTLKPLKGGFDPAHIAVSSLNMDIENGTFIKDTIKGQFKDFSATERGGLVVKHLIADTKITPKQITLNHLLIETNNSEVKDYFQMNFHDFRAFTKYPTDVHMKSNLKNCKVSFWDIACFAPDVKDVISKTLLVDGEINGPVNDLHGKDLKLQFGNNGIFYGDVELKGLPDIDETFATIDIRQLTANSNDLKILLPHIKVPDNVSTLGQINFTGNYTGFINDFVAYGSFNTSIGSVKTDVNFKVNKQNHASYSGNFSSDNFNLGKFFGNDSLLGTITLNADINGSGLRADNVSAQMKSNISQFVFNHYNYHDLTVFGHFDRKKFDGKLNVNDKNLNVDFSGNVDFNDTIPKLNFTADVTGAHLQNIHFANKDYVLNSTMNLNLSGNDIDNMIGNVNIEHTKFALSGKSYEMDSIHVISSLSGSEKTITVKTDVLDATLAGNFYLYGFYNSFVTMMKHYFPSWPITAGEQPAIQKMKFTFIAKNVAPFTKFFFPNISGFTGSSASGSLNTSDNYISMTGSIPEIDYKNFKFQSIDLGVSITGHDRLKMKVNTKNIWLSDSASIQDVAASFAVRNDSALCHLDAQDSASANRLNLSGWLIGNPDSIKFSFFKSRLYLNNMAWVIPDSNSITYTQNYILVNDLHFNAQNGQIAISGIKTSSLNTITALFTNVKIEDFYNLLKIHDYSIYGTLNGKLAVINPLQHMHVTSDLTIDNARLNTDSLGELVANINLDTTEQSIDFNFSLKRDSSDAEVIGNYNLYSDSGLNAAINLKKVKLAFASPFLVGLASDIKGNCNGTLKLNGTLSKPQLTGKVIIPSAETTIDYLKTHYKFYNEPVDFTNNLISFHDVTLYDAYKNKATLGGEIIHDHLTEFRLNLYMKDLKNFLLLNTTQRDNDLFYGKAFGSGTVFFTGPLNDLEINAEVRSEKNTVISIPISGGQNITDRSFIKFISADTSLKNTEETLLNNGSLKLNFDLDITPDAQINIILDQTTGDIIKGNGNGNLRMEINTAGSFNMYGTYTIESGDYLFTYQNIVHKPFTLDRGGTISWSGDPYKAHINLSAIYSLQANLSSLTSTGQNTDQQTASQNVPVNVVMNLTGSLLTPTIDFDITVPDQSSTFSDLALSRLQQIREDKNELNKQVFSLLLTKSFIPEQSSTITSIGTSAITTSLSEFFTSQLSSIFSSINNTTNVNLNYYTLNSINQLNATNGKEFVAEVKQRLLNNRLTITVGGNVDVNSAPASQNSSTNIAGDFDIDYLLTPDGRYILKAFRKNQYDDIAQQNININGVGISFRKEFDKFKEIFHRTNKKKQDTTSQ